METYIVKVNENVIYAGEDIHKAKTKAYEIKTEQNRVHIETWKNGCFVSAQAIEELTDYICVVTVFGHDGARYREDRNYAHETIFVGTIEKSLEDYADLKSTDEVAVIESIHVELWKNNERMRNMYKYLD